MRISQLRLPLTDWFQIAAKCLPERATLGPPVWDFKIVHMIWLVFSVPYKVRRSSFRGWHSLTSVAYRSISPNYWLNWGFRLSIDDVGREPHSYMIMRCMDGLKKLWLALPHISSITQIQNRLVSLQIGLLIVPPLKGCCRNRYSLCSRFRLTPTPGSISKLPSFILSMRELARNGLDRWLGPGKEHQKPTSRNQPQ